MIALTNKARQTDSEVISQLTALSTVNKEIVKTVKCGLCGCTCQVPEAEAMNIEEFGCEQCYFDNNQANELVWGVD